MPNLVRYEVQDGVAVVTIDNPPVNALAPEVFEPDDFGHCVVIAPEVDGAAADQARIGAENCPERAITVEQ